MVDAGTLKMNAPRASARCTAGWNCDSVGTLGECSNSKENRIAERSTQQGG